MRGLTCESKHVADPAVAYSNMQHTAWERNLAENTHAHPVLQSSTNRQRITQLQSCNNMNSDFEPSSRRAYNMQNSLTMCVQHKHAAHSSCVARVALGRTHAKHSHAMSGVRTRHFFESICYLNIASFGF